MRAYDVDSVPKLAQKMDYSSRAIYKWMERGSIPVKKISRLFPELNEDFLQTGEGSPFLSQRPFYMNENDPKDYLKEPEEIYRLIEKLPSSQSDELHQDDALKMIEAAESLLRIAKELMKRSDH